MQEYLTNYYAEKHQKSHSEKSILGSSPPGGSGPGHTILKKSLDHPTTTTGDAAAEGDCSRSPSMPDRHAKFRDVVEIVEFGQRDKVKTGVHFAHEEQLHDDEEDDDEEYEYDDDNDQTETLPSASTTSSTSDEPVLFFSQEDDNPDKFSTAGSEAASSTPRPSSGGSPEPPRPDHVDDGASLPLLGGDDVAGGTSKEHQLQNIFTSLSCRGGGTLADGLPEQQQRQHSTVKHVRLMDRMKPVEREEEFEDS